MKLWKVDATAGTVRQVAGEPYPGRDEEGDKCYENTHFADETTAWEKLLRETAAGVALAGSAVVEARRQLDLANDRAGRAAALYTKARDEYDLRGLERVRSTNLVWQPEATA